MAAPKKHPVEVRDRAIRLVQDLVADEELQLSVTGACTRVGQQLGINRDTLRGWVKQAAARSWLTPMSWLRAAVVGLMASARRERCLYTVMLRRGGCTTERTTSERMPTAWSVPYSIC